MQGEGRAHVCGAGVLSLGLALWDVSSILTLCVWVRACVFTHTHVCTQGSCLFFSGSSAGNTSFPLTVTVTLGL